MRRTLGRSSAAIRVGSNTGIPGVNPLSPRRDKEIARSEDASLAELASKAALLREAAAAARAINPITRGEWRATAVAALARHLPEPERSSAFVDALAAASTINALQKSGRVLARVLVALAPDLPEAMLGEALTAAQTIDEDELRLRYEVFAALAPRLPEELLVDALFPGLGKPRTHEEAFASIVLHPEAERDAAVREALAAARARLAAARASQDLWWGSQDLRWSAEELALIAPHLPEAERDLVFREALEASQSIDYGRGEALARLAPRLPEALLGEALAMAREIDGAEALAGLAPHLPEALLGEALAIARGIGIEEVRAEALAALAPYLPEALLGQALATAQAIYDDAYRTYVTVMLVPYLPSELWEDALGCFRKVVPGHLDVAQIAQINERRRPSG